MSQEIQYINIKDLVLWTENPRDPIDAKAKDQDIADKAIEDKHSKWTLAKLSKEMGDYYDLSELPTVVYHGKKPIVYDGNRRMILAKIYHGLVTLPEGVELNVPEIPKEIPCNVCTKKIALTNVYRKHSDSGSWLPLERDTFLHKFMGEEKSPFYILEEDTGIISANPHLNQRFVKEEVFKEESLKSMGFTVQNGRLKTTHSNEQAHSILSDISQKVKKKAISTRENRGKVFEVLDPTSQSLIDNNSSNKAHLSKISFGDAKEEEEKKIRQSRRISKKETELFGGKLYLKIGEVSNLYRDIVDLHQFYTSKKETLSNSFTSLIRMSLRLLCETAAKDKNKKLDDYLKGNYESAKKSLDQNIKTTLSTQNVNENTIVQLLHTGAHNYQASNNMNQTIALSLIIGSILTVTHGKED